MRARLSLGGPTASAAATAGATPGSREHDPFWRLVTLLLAVFGAVCVFLAYRSYGFEDAYITYRYAQNIAAGNGFVFNPGERVLGSSTPLYALVLAAFGAFGADIATAGAALFAASLGAVAVLGAGVLRRVGHPALGVAFAVAAVWAAGDLPYFFGMETPFYLALLLAAFTAALVRREIVAGTLAGLAFSTRHDAVLFAAALFALWWARERRLPWRGASAGAATVAPWLLFATVYFGSPITNTLNAKAGEVEFFEYLTEGTDRQLWSLFSPLDSFVPRQEWPRGLLYAANLILFGPIALAGWKLVRRDLLLGVTIVFPVALWLAYAGIGASPNFGWYLVPGTYFLLLAALASWGVLTKRAPLIRPAGAVAALATVAATLAFLLPEMRVHADSMTRSSFYRGRNGVYLTIARWLGDFGLDRVPLLLDEPGYLSYHSGSPVVDAAGLVTKGIYFTGPVERRTPFKEILGTFRPGLVLTPGVAGARVLDRNYVPLYRAQPVRTLYVRRGLFEDRFPSLARRWLAGTAYHPDPVVPATHPIGWDFDQDDASDWTTGGPVGDAGRVPIAAIPLVVGGSGRMLHTQGAPDLWGTVSSPPFLIDFDELRFLFGATHPWLTRARLLVNGQEVLSEGGNGNPLELREVRWPLSAWTGRIGTLQLVDIDTEGGFVIVEDVRSKRYRHLTKVDDSEFDRGFWSDGSPVPTPLEEVARKAGLAMMVGRHAMTTRHLQGTVEIASKPFRVRRAQISFLVFDFGGADTRIELHLDGEPRRAFVGSASRALRAVTWQVRDLRGEEATLVMRDGDLDLDRWIGIDEVASFDR